jgi:hypothetical protein
LALENKNIQSPLANKHSQIHYYNADRQSNVLLKIDKFFNFSSGKGQIFSKLWAIPVDVYFILKA